jgi:2-polyprenyl-3-methyl-5-hydroxy-6-metoxy-1,4-benzoquinol methylase
MPHEQNKQARAGSQPLVAELVELIAERNPPHRKHLDSVMPRIHASEYQHLEKYLQYCLDSGRELSYLADSYLLLVADAVTELMYFQRKGNYRYSTLAEVGDHVYFDKEYMDQYMYGVAISLIFWSSHREMRRFFEETLPLQKSGTYLEIGPGHGSFLMWAMERSAFSKFLGIDISATSIAQTRAVIDHFNPAPDANLSLTVQDFHETTLPPGSCDAIVMGEVLEHVEDPARFLAKIRELAADNAHIFVTTCANAPQKDHIFLFRTLEEIIELIKSQGLKVVSQKAVPYEGKTLEQCVKQVLPINVAYVLKVA